MKIKLKVIYLKKVVLLCKPIYFNFKIKNIIKYNCMVYFYQTLFKI